MKYYFLLFRCFTIVAALALTSCLHCSEEYEGRSSDLPPEIMTISSTLRKASVTSNSEHEIYVSIQKYFSRVGNAHQLKTIKPNSLTVNLSFSENDTLIFKGKIESIYVFRHSNIDQLWKNNDHITAELSFVKINSFGEEVFVESVFAMQKTTKCSFRVH